MKRTFVILGVFILISVSFYCTKDTNLFVKEQPSKLVVHALAAEGEPFNISVAKSADVLTMVNRDRDLIVPEAKVFLYADDIPVDTFDYDGPYKPFISRSNILARSGVRYKLIVVSPGMPEAEAETFLSSNSPVITKSTFTGAIKKVKDDYGYRYLREAHLQFTDPPDAENYYTLRVLVPYSWVGSNVFYRETNCLSTNDTDVEKTDFGIFSSECNYGYLYFNDKYFNGRQKDLLLGVDPSGSLNLTDTTDKRIYRPVIEVTEITADYFKYKKSVEQYDYARDNPFAEPVSIFSNIQNGYGVFAISRIQTDTIR